MWTGRQMPVCTTLQYPCAAPLTNGPILLQWCWRAAAVRTLTDAAARAVTCKRGAMPSEPPRAGHEARPDGDAHAHEYSRNCAYRSSARYCRIRPMHIIR